MEIHHQLIRARAEGKVAAVIAMDQSAAFDVIDHAILKRKLIHIGIEAGSVELIMEYLFNRKQQVINNTNTSDILLTGECSVSQGSLLSGLLYIIYTLDMHEQLHPIKHSNNLEYFKCNNTYTSSYVDDCYGTVKGNNGNIWNKIANFIDTMSKYYINNKLYVNVDKTKVMIVNGSQEVMETSIIINNQTIKNNRTLKILGTTFNCKLNWDDTI